MLTGCDRIYVGIHLHDSSLTEVAAVGTQPIRTMGVKGRTPKMNDVYPQQLFLGGHCDPVGKGHTCDR
jgi:hypothetical protein